MTTKEQLKNELLFDLEALEIEITEEAIIKLASLYYSFGNTRYSIFLAMG